MTETSRKAQWFSDNERNWDDRAELHMAGNYCDYQHLLEDPTAISAELAQDIENLAISRAKEVIHLQCHVGTDTIGFARRGASRVIGLDLSEASLAHARSIAERAGVTSTSFTRTCTTRASSLRRLRSGIHLDRSPVLAPRYRPVGTSRRILAQTGRHFLHP